MGSYQQYNETMGWETKNRNMAVKAWEPAHTRPDQHDPE
jgi:hypothetical protein